MATGSESVSLSAPWAERISRLRWRIRCYILLQGLATVLAVLVAGFWISLFIDWNFEPSAAVRGVLLVTMFLAVAAAAYRVSVSRLLVPLADRSMAMLLERQHRSLGDRLVTVVELSQRGSEQQEFDPRMLVCTRDEVDRMLPATGIGPIFNSRPLFKSFSLAVVLLFSVVAFCYWQPEAVRIWAQRSLLLKNASWPRATKILVEGFPADPQGRRIEKLARGGNFAIRARADMKWLVPDAVQIHYEADAGVVRRPNMTRLNRAVPGRDTHQDYEYQFTNVQSSIPFSVTSSGGGLFSKPDRVEELLIEVVESPDLSDIHLQYDYPKYLRRKPETASVRRSRPIPEGTRVRALGRANKPLRSATYRKLPTTAESVGTSIPITEHDRQSFEVDLGVVGEDTQVDFQLLDIEGITNQQPIRLLLRVTPDEKPVVSIELSGIGKSITPFAALPIRGVVNDDHGVAKTWFDFYVDGASEQRLDFTLPDSGQLDDAERLAFDVEPWQLQPGQRLSLQVKAADHCDLRAEPLIGESNRYQLRVVTESQLRADLETRERLLRRRFETILAELRRMDDSLKRMVPLDPEVLETGLPAGETKTVESGSVGPGRAVSIRLVRVEAAIQSSDRMRHETASIAEEFARILTELKNNRVSFIEELERRIDDQIVTPLNTITSQQFPRFDRELQKLREVAGDTGKLTPEVDRSRKQLRRIISRMDQVLESMLKLQRFNEVLADLRKIIEAQRQVSRQTLEQRRLLEKQLKEQLKKDLLD